MRTRPFSPVQDLAIDAKIASVPQTPPKIVIETAEGKKLFLIDDPNKIIGATIELQCGPQKKTTVKVDYVPANQAGVEGLVRGLQFQQ